MRVATSQSQWNLFNKSTRMGGFLCFFRPAIHVKIAKNMVFTKWWMCHVNWLKRSTQRLVNCVQAVTIISLGPSSHIGSGSLFLTKWLIESKQSWRPFFFLCRCSCQGYEQMDGTVNGIKGIIEAKHNKADLEHICKEQVELEEAVCREQLGFSLSRLIVCTACVLQKCFQRHDWLPSMHWLTLSESYPLFNPYCITQKWWVCCSRRDFSIKES